VRVNGHPLKARSRSGVVLTERDLALFRGLFESRLMALSHITALYFDGRADAAMKRVQRLKRAKYLAERPRRLYEPSILHLARAGFEALIDRGVLRDYPRLTWAEIEGRARVSELTLRHELAVLDVKTALSRALSAREEFSIIEFSTWPRLYQFSAAQPPRPGVLRPPEVLIKPDGFLRLAEEDERGILEHTLFLEVDRSTEPRETLALRAFGYQDYYRRGGLSVRFGHRPDRYKEFPFRVLFVFPTAERRNNMAERLLQNEPPILGLCWLTTQEELVRAPLAPIWIRPADYQAITQGTPFDPARAGRDPYRRRPEREALVDWRIRRLPLFA